MAYEFLGTLKHFLRYLFGTLETAHALRSAKATQKIPIVFVDGKNEEVDKVRVKLSHAVFSELFKIEHLSD